MLTVLRNCFNDLAARVELAAQSSHRWLEARRLENRYPAQPPRAGAPLLGLGQQASAMASIVQQHCSSGTSIVGMHDNATMKLDAAEYAFSSMLEELKGAMSSLPTSWAPDRTWGHEDTVLPLVSDDHQAGEAKAA